MLVHETLNMPENSKKCTVSEKKNDDSILIKIWHP